jgi:hypothetical protein
MNDVPSIDLHPDKIRGSGPEAAIRACRDFLDRSLRAGHRELRIITGVGLRGDGTPRLRTRVEEEVLGAYYRQIEQQSYEQGGAVIHLWLKPQVQTPSKTWQREQRHQDERRQVAGREERLLVAWDRLALAEEAYEDGDLRRCRLKLNQLAKEFGWQVSEGVLDDENARRLLKEHRVKLEQLDR